MITYKQVDKSYFEEYDKIPMLVHVKSIYKLKKINNGLGVIFFKEESVKEYIKDLGVYEIASKYEKEFDISNWVFYDLL